ncbi:MAG: hypothetical protein ABI416_15665 [Ginsengibacter sp.]
MESGTSMLIMIFGLSRFLFYKPANYWWHLPVDADIWSYIKSLT